MRMCGPKGKLKLVCGKLSFVFPRFCAFLCVCVCVETDERERASYQQTSVAILPIALIETKQEQKTTTWLFPRNRSTWRFLGAIQIYIQCVIIIHFHFGGAHRLRNLRCKWRIVEKKTAEIAVGADISRVRLEKVGVSIKWKSEERESETDKRGVKKCGQKFCFETSPKNKSHRVLVKQGKRVPINNAPNQTIFQKPKEKKEKHVKNLFAKYQTVLWATKRKKNKKNQKSKLICCCCSRMFN